MAEHIINSRVHFPGMEGSYLGINKVQAHMAIDRVVTAQTGPSLDLDSNVNLSKLPRYDQLDINSRSGVFVD